MREYKQQTHRTNYNSTTTYLTLQQIHTQIIITTHKQASYMTKTSTTKAISLLLIFIPYIIITRILLDNLRFVFIT